MYNYSRTTKTSRRTKLLKNSWKIKLLLKPVSNDWFCSSFSFISWPKRADKSHKTSFILSISTIKSRWSDLKDSCHCDVSHTSFSSGFGQWESLPSFAGSVKSQVESQNIVIRECLEDKLFTFGKIIDLLTIAWQFTICSMLIIRLLLINI